LLRGGGRRLTGELAGTQIAIQLGALLRRQPLDVLPVMRLDRIEVLRGTRDRLLAVILGAVVVDERLRRDPLASELVGPGLSALTVRRVL
jgi:hypothetical protein